MVWWVAALTSFRRSWHHLLEKRVSDIYKRMNPHAGLRLTH
jgi:hypothetical protein